MIKQLTKTAVLFGLVFSSMISSPLHLNAEEDGTAQTADEITEEPAEEVSEEIEDITSEEEIEPAEVLPEQESLMVDDDFTESDSDSEEIIYSDGNYTQSAEYSLKTSAGAYDVIPGADLIFLNFNGKDYWYENGVRQAVLGDPKNLIDEKYGVERGREIYDPGTEGWYWLDAVYDGAKAVGKEVWMPYVYQNEDQWTAEQKAILSHESDEGMSSCVLSAMITKSGKWVRYDENGAMLKGWVTISGALAALYPNQAGNTYYYDTRTGLMAKGYVTLNGTHYHFDEITGELLTQERQNPDVQPEPEPEPDYSPEPEPQPSGSDFVLNIRTGVYHRPTCSSVRRMNEGNKRYFSNTTSEQMRAQGYDPCNVCNP